MEKIVYHPHPYQLTAERWVLDHPRCCLFLDMGLGKTVVTLTAVKKLMDYCEVDRTLVVAPKKVAETTWSDEADKWVHLSSLRVVCVKGTAAQRRAALAQSADVYVIGRDSFVWLASEYRGRLPFDMLILDELTSFKSPQSKRFKAMRSASAMVHRVVGLTGTPAPNGLIDLWAQMYCVDGGERLGRSIGRYRDAYFQQYRWNNILVRCTPKPGSEAAIRGRLSDICLSMQAKDYLTLPPMMIHPERVRLSAEVMKGYNAFERDSLLSFADEHTGEDVSLLAGSAAALMNKLSQYANGAVYDEDGQAHEIHSEKLDSLAELVEAAGGPVLIFYQYRHDIPRIAHRLKGRKVCKYEDETQLREWNQGHIDVLLAHPASTAYGLNMQQGGHVIIWFGTGWNLELYQQANARLHRQGQAHPVMVYNLVCADTVDERAAAALSGKKRQQQALLDNLSALMRKHNVKQWQEIETTRD